MMAMDGATMEADAPRRSMMSKLGDERQLAGLRVGRIIFGEHASPSHPRHGQG